MLSMLLTSSHNKSILLPFCLSFLVALHCLYMYVCRSLLSATPFNLSIIHRIVYSRRLLYCYLLIFQIRQNYPAPVGVLPEPDFCRIWKKCRIPAGAEIRYSPTGDVYFTVTYYDDTNKPILMITKQQN